MGGGEISAIGQIYIQRVRYGSIGSRARVEGMRDETKKEEEK